MAKIDDTDFEQYIYEIRHTISVASLNYDIWWCFKSKETRKKYTDIMNRYSAFFMTGINAHFVAMLIPLYRLYENKDDTYNIPSFLDYIRQNDHLPADVMIKVDDLKTTAAPLWKKIKILRNRAFGHRSRAHTTEELFKEAKVKPEDLQNMISISQDILNHISYCIHKETYAFNINATSDTIRLLDALAR